MHPSEIVKDIDFGAVGSTDLEPLDFKSAILKEKLSVMLFAKCCSTAKTAPDNLLYSEFRHPYIENNSLIRFTVESGRNVYSAPVSLSKEIPRITWTKEETVTNPKGVILVPGYTCVPIKKGARIEEISIFDYMRTISNYPDSTRIEELLVYFDMEKHPYSTFNLAAAFRPQQFPDALPTVQNVNSEDFNGFQRKLEKWCKSCFPRWYIIADSRNQSNNSSSKRAQDPKTQERERTPYAKGQTTFGVPLPSPAFYTPLGPMAYDVREYRKLPQIRVQRFFHNPDGCGLREGLIPTVCIKINGYQCFLMTGLPNMEKMPLWNIKRIMSPNTDTVVLCGCIQDAEALQRENKDVKHVAFTGCVGDCLEQIDFSPLTGKKVVFLLSNHNDLSLEDSYEEVARIHEYLSEQIKPSLDIAEFAFVQRQVQYPDNSAIATPKDLASTYYYHHPVVDPESMIPPMNESEFRTMLAKIRNSHEPFWKPSASVPQTPKSRVDNFVVRGFLYKGDTTLLAGKSGSKKTHFAVVLGRYVAAGDIPFLSDRFWTRAKPEGFPKKVVYWCFDDVSEKEIEQQNAYYKKGLSKEFADNFFIELAPETVDMGKLEIKAFKNALEDYNSRGFPGLPVSLLIIDHLSALKGDDHRADALRFLAHFKRNTMPDLAILVLHHLGQRDTILGGSGVTMGPRINVTMKKSGNVFELAYQNSTNISLADVEKEPFSFVYNGLGVKVHEPKHNSEEMFRLIANYYKNEDYMQYDNDEIGILLGYNGETVGKKLRGKMKKKAGKASSTTEEAGQEASLDSQSEAGKDAQESPPLPPEPKEQS